MKIRYNMTFRKYSLWERLSLWFRNVCQAVRETPPDQYAVWIPLNPGEPGYENAWFEMSICESPIVFKRPVPDK